MIYSQLYLKNRNYIPMPLAILIIFLLIIFFSQLFHRSSAPSKASKKLLTRLEIANLNYNQATIFWQTDEKTTGYIVYGENKNKTTNFVFDDRDTPTEKNQFFSHMVNLRNLTPQKQYFFLIMINDQIVKQENGAPFSFFTPKFQLENRSPKLIYGKILQSNNQPLTNAIIFLSVNQYYPFLSVSKGSGEWLIPLNILYQKESLAAKIPANDEKATIEILSEEGEKTTVTGKIDQFSPIPQTLVIGKNYNFLFEENVLGVQNETADESKKTNQDEIEISFPQENAVIPGNTPIIKGKALPEKEVFLTLFSLADKNKNYSARVKADKGGFWSLKFLENLSPAAYQLILQTKDQNDKDFQLKRNFRLIGNQAIEGRVLGEATPSATIIPSPTLLPTSISTPTVILTPTTPVSGGSNIVLLSIFGFLSIILGLRLLFNF
jgi:hypothetical protein